MPAKKVGRPPKLGPVTRDAVARVYANGGTLDECAQAAGVAPRTIDTWLSKARQADHRRREGKKPTLADKPFLLLFDEIVEAESNAEFEALQKLNQYLVVGVDLETAARAARVPNRMLARLRDRATFLRNRLEDGDRIDSEGRELAELLDTYEHSLALTKVTMLASIQSAGRTDWRAAAYWLERNFPEEYASPNRKPKGMAAGGRPLGATSAPDRPSTADEPPPRLRLTRADNG